MDITKTYFLLRVTDRTQVTILSYSTDEMALINQQIVLEDQRIANGTPVFAEYHAVRQYGSHDGLVKKALDGIKLAARQSEALIALDRATRDGSGRRAIRPGYEAERWDRVSAIYPSDLLGPAKRLQDKGLIQMSGVAYGPKTYRVTGLGRVVAAHLAQVNDHE